MSFHKMPKATIRPGDSAEMRKTIEFLNKRDIDVRRPINSNHQLKLDETTSYYPNKGTIHVDGEPMARPERGRAALKDWVNSYTVQLIMDQMDSEEEFD